MSLEKDASTFIAQCDFCPDTHDTEESDFYSAVEAIKRVGWRVFKKGAEWFHKCGCCQAEAADARDFGDVE